MNVAVKHRITLQIQTAFLTTSFLIRVTWDEHHVTLRLRPLTFEN